MSEKVIPGRNTAAAENGVVVFHIGLRINRLRALSSWLPAFRSMPRMLRELSREKSRGLLGYKVLHAGLRDFYVVQYWTDKDSLLAYAHQRDLEHRPAWTEFNRRARAGKGNVGIWHETFIVPAGSYESVYVDMPAYGLAAATGVVPVARRGDTAAQRLGAAER
ncbi:DUF4188 domain-containing protein [Streptomyces sp. V2]|uniref:DUF4188 domain-containing protein n=1 Tax=Streptomyces niveiscabiei TaxID=164115 RepID=A0ABW9HKN4_9ACTN|nr:MULTISPECIES: DUF4188 domain-containing protein [unclassified Streptomyces]PWG15160.1 DUF4188 domain-containing protein [Streptomyces sp. V2]QZZ30724.1 DUF4188 domain-containing protein [Streptomyces sp. ST1015]